MNDAAVAIRFDDNGRIYQPGETLSGEYVLESVPPGAVSTIEVSVLWYSEGKGDEDLAMHEFWRRSIDEGDYIDPGRAETFRTTLPQSPLSYDGLIVKLRWCVRVRAFLRSGKELFGQKAFRLGNVPAAKVHAAKVQSA
ncbi:MAG: hypothetical protein A2V70_19690 [Planctomycetes bacterium RBG_13_63_9]|nr:MAG: hypothetical protein A2V70_19690 [Planctomycetes bacterium RBG_13_63_9]